MKPEIYKQIDYYTKTANQPYQETMPSLHEMYPNQMAQMPIQAPIIEQSDFFMGYDLNQIFHLAMQYWWVLAIFLIGFITVSIAGFRILIKKHKWLSDYKDELFKMWRQK